MRSKRPRSFQLTSSPHSLQVAIVEADDTGESLADKVRAAMALSNTASLELYLSSDGTPIEAGLTLAAQGVGDGAALDVVVSNPKVCGCLRAGARTLAFSVLCELCRCGCATLYKVCRVKILC